VTGLKKKNRPNQISK